MNRVLLFGVVVLLLTGCVSTSPSPTPTAQPSTPAPTTTAELATAPIPLLEVGCDDLVPAQTAAALSTTPLTSFGDTYAYLDAASYGIPLEFPLRQLQGTACNWNNELPEVDPNGESNAFTSLTVYALPNADAAWANYLALYGDEASALPACNGADLVNARCWWTGLTADGSWLEITYAGMRNAGSDAANVAAFTPLVDGVVAGVVGAPHGETWMPPTPAAPIPLGCPSVLTDADIASAAGIARESVNFSSGPEGGTSLLYEAARQLGADDCRWFVDDVFGDAVNSYGVLRGGAWAWAVARATDDAVASARPFAVDGLRDGDSAWVRDSHATIVDLIIDGNWISITVYPEDLAGYAVDGSGLTALANAAVRTARQ